MEWTRDSQNQQTCSSGKGDVLGRVLRTDRGFVAITYEPDGIASRERLKPVQWGAYPIEAHTRQAVERVLTLEAHSTM